jgi:hypothetical protein
MPGAGADGTFGVAIISAFSAGTEDFLGRCCGGVVGREMEDEWGCLL